MYGYNSGAVAFGYIIGIIVLLVVNGLLASNASDIAHDKGYEKRKWFHMCFWLSLPAYLIICAMPDKNLALAMHEIARKLEKQQPTASQASSFSQADADTKQVTAFNDLPNL